jgi:hypothetical protein
LIYLFIYLSIELVEYCTLITRLEIRVLIAGPIIPLILLMSWMGISGVVGLIYGCRNFCVASKNLHMSPDTVASSSPDKSSLKIFAGMIGGVIGLTLITIIYGAFFLNFVYSDLDSYATDDGLKINKDPGCGAQGILAVSFPVVILFFEVPQLVVLIQLLKGSQRGCATASSIHPVFVGEFYQDLDQRDRNQPSPYSDTILCSPTNSITTKY